MNGPPPRPIAVVPYAGLAAVCLAPGWVGGMHPYGQALTGSILALGLAWDCKQSAATLLPMPRLSRLWPTLLILLLCVAQWLPLPSAGVAWLQPGRFAFAGAPDPQASSSWMTFAVSPAAGIQRLWEVILACGIFMAFRQGAADARFAGRAAGAIMVTIALQCLADLYYRIDGQRALLGIWPVSWGTGAGTFANRNHFAGFLVVAILFGLGAVARGPHPRAKTNASHADIAPPHRRRLELWGTGTCLLVALGFVAGTGSRGALLALAVGGLVWAWLQGRHVHSLRQRQRLLAFALVALTAVILASGFVLARFAAGTGMGAGVQSRAFIWRESLELFLHFPWFGVGLGGFATAFNRFKSAGGEATYLHAENEAIEMLVEMGVFGTILALFALTRFVRDVRSLLARTELRDREWVIGAVAALAAFAVHAIVEFVAQIPANLFLAAALAGLLSGAACLSAGVSQTDASNMTAWRSRMNAFAAVLLAGVAACQAIAAWRWSQALALDRAGATSAALRPIESSLALWPIATGREIGRLRAEGKRLAATPAQDWAGQLPAILGRGERSRVLDPLHWELHWERLWLRLAYGPADAAQRAQVRQEAEYVMRLNPRQPWIPLRLARHFMSRDPDYTRTLLARAPLESPAVLRATLEIAWELERQAGVLWRYVPDQPWALEVLAEYALTVELPRMAAEAYRRLYAHVPDRLKLAGRLLRCGEPQAALRELADQVEPGPVRWMLEARAHAALGEWTSARRALERLLQDQAGMLALVPADFAVAPALAFEQARNWVTDPSVPLADFESLAERYPQDTRIQVLLFRAAIARGEDQRAVQAGLRAATALFP